MAAHVTSRPCIYERRRDEGQQWELWDRPAFRGARTQARKWVTEALAKGPRAARTVCDVDVIWPELAAYVGAPKTIKDPSNQHEDISPADIERRNVRTAFTFGVRADQVCGVRHGAQWRRWREAEGQDGQYHRDGACGCAACMAARWEGNGWQQQRRRGRARAPPASAAQQPAQATVVTSHRFETLQHVLTECDGTGGRRAFAGDMRDQAESAKAAMAGEAHPAPARAAAQLAVEGWAAAARGTPVAPSKWRAMRALLGGILPQWKDGKGDTREQRDRAKAVARSVATMQTLAADRVKAHRKRAAKAVQWVRDREQARPMLQLMLRAWAGVARTTAAARVAGAPMLGPEDRILDDEQYKQWKANETPAARRKRLTDNSAIRLSRLGEFVVSPPRAALRRRLALKRGLKRHLASMRARRRLGDALAGVRGLIRDARNERTRRIGRASGATRTSTVIATVLSRLATLRPARPRAQVSLPPRRRTAVHRAAALGPATSGLIASYERLGYG